MGFPNVALRGSTYYRRKKITIAGVHVPLALRLDTGRSTQACIIALRLGSAVEALRMAYGQSSGMAPDKLRQIFGDAMRRQLQRILEDQAGSRIPSVDHATVNSIHAEAWGFLARHKRHKGQERTVTHDDAELVQLRLIDDFLEEEGDDTVADDGFDKEVERAIVAVGNSKLRDIRLALNQKNSDAWVVSLRHARLRARKPVTS